MTKSSLPTQRPSEVLAWVDRNIHYEPATGNIYRYWFKELCTCRQTSGYIVVAVNPDKNKTRAERLTNKSKTHMLLGQHIAWYKTHGVWPAFQINHINGKRDDNRISNLEPTDSSSNIAKGGLSRNKQIRTPRGVLYRPRLKSKPYEAKITKDKKTYYLGYFSTQDEACNAVQNKFRELYGCDYVEPLRSNVDYVPCGT